MAVVQVSEVRLMAASFAKITVEEFRSPFVRKRIFTLNVLAPLHIQRIP